MKPLGRNLPTRNSHTFLNGGDSLGIVARIPGYGVKMLGADGARVRMDVFAVGSFSSRSEGDNRFPCRFFTGNVNGQLIGTKNLDDNAESAENG